MEGSWISISASAFSMYFLLFWLCFRRKSSLTQIDSSIREEYFNNTFQIITLGIIWWYNSINDNFLKLQCRLRSNISTHCTHIISKSIGLFGTSNGFFTSVWFLTLWVPESVSGTRGIPGPHFENNSGSHCFCKTKILYKVNTIILWLQIMNPILIELTMPGLYIPAGLDLQPNSNTYQLPDKNIFCEFLSMPQSCKYTNVYYFIFKDFKWELAQHNF